MWLLGAEVWSSVTKEQPVLSSAELSLQLPFTFQSLEGRRVLCAVSFSDALLSDPETILYCEFHLSNNAWRNVAHI